MSAAYRLRTVWRLPAPPARCWAEIVAALRPGAVSWWRGVSIVSASDRLAAGAELTMVVRGPLGYRLRMRLVLTDVREGTLLAARAGGDLHGEGELLLRAAGAGAEAAIRWEVELGRRWMRASSWVLRPAFVAVHTAVMRRGERALRRRLGA